MPAPEYTTCVKPADYEDPGLPSGGFFGGLWGFIVNGGLDLLLRICDYMLHGKLVCLGGDECAIGRVASFETVDDKSGLDKIDNDFSINLALCPNPLSGLQAGKANRHANHDNAVANKQGHLISEQPGMPIPREEIDSEEKLSDRFTGTFVKIHTILTLDNPIPEDIANESDSDTWHLPVFHCEIEGERANTVCTAAGVIIGPIHDTVCAIPIIGGIICFLLTVFLAIFGWPLLLIAAGILAAAWAAGANDNRDFDGGGDLKANDLVLIRGRWCYDAGHTGWNELHPVRHIQKISDETVCQWANFDDLRNRWCWAVSKVPPTPPHRGGKPEGMTPDQEATWGAQTKPENRWHFHPMVDGCVPDDHPEPPG